LAPKAEPIAAAVPVIDALETVAKKRAAIRSARRRSVRQAAELKHAPEPDPDETLQLSAP